MPPDPVDPLRVLIRALATRAATGPDLLFLAADPDQPFPAGTPRQLRERDALPVVLVEHDPRYFPRAPSSPLLLSLGGHWERFYLREYDPDAEHGKGRIAVTKDRTEAFRFSSWEEAFNFCKQQSTVVPTRRDGKPNRPLEAISIEIAQDLLRPPGRRR